MKNNQPTVIEADSLLIKPSDIDTSKHPYGAFGKSETEASARWIVRLCQIKNQWGNFKLDDIEELYSSSSNYSGYSFNTLVEDGFIQEDQGMYSITIGFILRYAWSLYKRGRPWREINAQRMDVTNKQ